MHDLSFEEHDKHVEEEQKRRRNLEQEADGEDDLGVGDEEESGELLLLDPKEWKVSRGISLLTAVILSPVLDLFRNKTIMLSLGCRILDIEPLQSRSKLPVCASLNPSSSTSHYSIDLDRKKVLKHHPDKKAGAVGDSNDDAFFKCIQKANDILTHPEKRRQFDSIDTYYDQFEADIPTAQQVIKSKDPNSTFFKLFAPIFEREARFSRKEPVPLLGEYSDSKEKVETFYDFWYNFDSWRSFEYHDKEVNEGSDRYGAFFLGQVVAR